MLLVLASLAAASAVASSVNDSKASDAVAAFSQLCVGMFSGGQSDIDPARFSVTMLPPETVKKVKPELAGQTVWDVSGKISDVHMLVHYQPSGMCVIEVAEADEAAIRANYAALVEQVALTTKTKAERQPDRTNPLQGQNATTSMWRLTMPKRDIMLAVTTYPEKKFMIQHLMTVSYVR